MGTDLKKMLSNEILLCPSKKAFDITQFEKVRKYINKHPLDLIINTAALHDVDRCESEIEESFLLNAVAVKNLANVCKEKDISLVHISTAHVFGGDEKRRRPYIETDAPDPVNVYGISKLAGEYCVRQTLKKYFIIRTTALFGVKKPSGKRDNFIGSMLRFAKERGEVKVKNDEFTNPTYTKDLAKNIAKLIKTKKYGIYHIVSHGECSWYDLAKKAFELTKTRVTCQPASSDKVITAAKRPFYACLENKHLKEIGLDEMRPWQDALKAYLEEKNLI